MTPSVTTDTVFRITSRFAPFIMSDDGCEGTDEAWIGYHCLIFAYVDALDDLRHFDANRSELRQLLRETGFHEVARLRKQSNLLAFSDEEFDALLERLASAGLHEIALKADKAREWQSRAMRNYVPRASTEAKRQLIAKLERLATSSNLNEAASANARIEEIKAKYEIELSDPDDFDLEAWDAPLQLTPTAELLFSVEEAWIQLKPLGDIHYGLEEEPERMHQRLLERAHRLEKLLREHKVLKHREPIVQRRRP